VRRSSGRGVGLEWTLKFPGRSRANALGLIISQSGVKELQLLLLLPVQGIRETLILLILMLLIILTGTTETDLEDGREATQIAVPEGQFDNGSGTLATIETQKLW
jgi:hypothetical protein